MKCTKIIYTDVVAADCKQSLSSPNVIEKLASEAREPREARARGKERRSQKSSCFLPLPNRL